ncbi:hypothetical protein ACIBF1_17315 [Spirillospora sp. NPDC050679]
MATARAVGSPSGTPPAPSHRTPPVGPDTTAAYIQRRFPGVLCWYGRCTGRWWAYLPNRRGGCLLEAVTPDALLVLIGQAVRR